MLGTSLANVSVVDVRDVAKAHIAAFENPKAQGRHIMASEIPYTYIELANMLKVRPLPWPLDNRLNPRVVARV